MDNLENENDWLVVGAEQMEGNSHSLLDDDILDLPPEAKRPKVSTTSSTAAAIGGSSNRPNEEATQFTGNFKLHAALPQKMSNGKLDQLETACKEFCSHLSKMLPASPFVEGQVNELDLTLPSSYADLFSNNSQFLYQLLNQPIEKYPKSKVIRFPEMKLEIMSELINKLHDVIRSAAYDNICLSFIRLSHGDSTSICNFFQTLLSLIAPERVTCTAEIIDAAHLKKEIKKSISNFDVTIVDNNIILKSKFTKGVKPAVAPRPKSKARKKKVPLNLPPLSDTSQFSYDSYNISPHQIHEALSFTAYNYWNLDEIHREGYTGKGVNVAVIDTGIDDCHSAFNGTILQPITTCPTNKCSDMTGHGTLCAGILCGKSFLYENSIGNGKVVKQNFPPGVAPDCCLTVCKVTQLDSPQAFMTNMLATLKWIASNNIDVVNISMGSSGFSPEITKAISALVDKGVIVVCAASNHGYKFRQSVCFPARLGNVLCIGSHGPHGKPSDFSPVGQEIDFLAPGENITGPSNREYLNGVAIASGTSYAAPAVAGLICLILQFMKENVQLQNLAYLKNHWVMKELLRKMSTSPSRHSDDRGYGVLNPSVFCRNLSESITRICEDLYKEDEQQLS